MKLDLQSASRAKTRIANGEPIRELARELDVEYQTLYLLAKGETWKKATPSGDVRTGKRCERALTAAERDLIFAKKRKSGLSNARLAAAAGVSESVVARAMRDAKIVLAFRVQRLLLTSGGHDAAMEIYDLARGEAEALSSLAASSRIPKHLAEELEA